MKDLLYSLFNRETMTRQDACQTLLNIGSGNYTTAQITAFMTVFQMRGITLDELAGFRDALLQTCIPIDLSDYNAIDIVGTGGDNKNTFNISTCSCFVVAGAGYPVIKHGNYAATSISGASNVLEYHGIKFKNNSDDLRRIMDECGITYLHAPYFHPIMKSVAPIRKELGVRTFFNMLGPLVNPGMPTKKLLGVYNLKMARLYNYMFQQEENPYCIVHSLDGYDEISLTGDFKLISRVKEAILKPETIGFNSYKEEDIYGGNTINEASQIFDNVLSAKATKAQTDVVLVNSAYAIHTFKQESSISDCVEIARESILSGNAKRVFKKFVELSK